jgi:endonuclease-8
MRPILEGTVPDSISAPQLRHRADRWPQRLSGRAVERISTHGKHLLVHFEGGLSLHSHLRMTGAWATGLAGQAGRRSRRRAWLILQSDGHEVVNFDGPVLELMTAARTRTDPRLSRLGPDVLADQFNHELFLRRLREDDPTRGFGDALLDQTTIAGIGNIWKAETCWGAGIDPWRPIGNVSDEDASRAIELVRPRMMKSALGSERAEDRGAYRRDGKPCSRCGTSIKAAGQGDDNRITWWCPGCQR